MVLAGKISTEVGVRASADKFFHLFSKKLHDVQNHCERVHETILHEGDDWHVSDSVKQWTYVIDGKVHTCKESVEEIDEENKKLTFKLFGGDIDEHYKIFKLIIEVIDKADGSASVKWTIEYEKIHEDYDPPNGYMDYFAKCTKDMDAHLVNA
ncbi:MLP-like protein 43 [Cicer arietinum]|uniref:MLP-like protein 28 n=2 Tax=Cicer arietinum TaxID=3827 RepID=A0A1S3EEN6_CICAR|nr:MLP-like protein 28 [Cicer arietinum]